MGGIAGGGSKPKAAKAPVRVSRRVEEQRKQASSGGGKKSLGFGFLQSRKRTPTGAGGFGGQKPTLG